MTATSRIPSIRFSPSSSPRKRKMLLDDEKISEVLRDLNDEDVTVQKLKAFLNDAEQLTQQLTPSKKARLGAQIIQASSLETLSHVVQMFDLEYLEDEPSIWRVPEGPDVRLSDEAGTVQYIYILT